jgi:hypothetical protein
VSYFTIFIVAKRFSDLRLLAFEIDPHSQFEIIKLFLRTSFVPIPSYLEIVAIKEFNFEEVLDKRDF